MFRSIYEASASAFLLQGALLIPLLIGVSIVWRRQGARLDAVEAALGRDVKRRDRTLKSLIATLPMLQPLHCPACGGALALEAATTICTHCRAPTAPPADYAATIALRARLRRLTSAALFHWRQARVLTSTPWRLLLIALAFAEPAIFAITLIGAATYADTWLDRLFTRAGEQLSLALMLLSFGGFVIWMVVFLMLSSLSRTLRRQLPASPTIARDDAPATEFATCRSCGGGIRYDTRAFAALCGYCGVENYRADHGRRERAQAEVARATTRATLFGAMTIIEDFTGTFLFTTVILTTGFLLLVLVIALRR